MTETDHLRQILSHFLFLIGYFLFKLLVKCFGFEILKDTYKR
jgi:hypothetical protein